MKAFFVSVSVAVAFLLTGCDFEVPLAQSPPLDIAEKLLGVWERDSEQYREQRLLVLPMGRREYLVSFPHGSADAMFARAYLFRQQADILVQLEWLGTARGALPEDKRIYQVGRCDMENGRLAVRLLNTGVVDKDATTTAHLELSLIENRNHPELWGKPLFFVRSQETEE